MTSFHIYIPANFLLLGITTLIILAASMVLWLDLFCQIDGKNMILALKVIIPDSGISNRTKSRLVCSKKSGSGPKSGNPYLIWGTANAKSVLITKC